MNKKILIIGSTGKLGSILLNYTHKEKITINAITCFSNKKKLLNQSIKFNVNHSFILSLSSEKKNFINLISNSKFDIIYFLDFGSSSLLFLDIILKNNSGCTIAIANKEMIIAGGHLLRNKFIKSKNILIPLDSEHFSLFRLNPKEIETKNLYITASGGPFYFNKKINLNRVSKKEVISHPKWKMGINNSIDSSNFVNKVLEMFELSIIYNISISKIDFLISKEAFIHSLICFMDNTININCFENNMLIPLIKPLTQHLKSKQLNFTSEKYLDFKNLKLEIFNDKRFKIFKYLKKIKKFSHNQQVSFMILNNYAHNNYLNGDLFYTDIIDFIFDNIEPQKDMKFRSFHDILNYINVLKSKYEKF
jgi:1-deoxy-D-xylulose-5-phosphate reductoisomerase